MLSEKEKLKEYLKKNPSILLDELAKEIGTNYWLKKETITLLFKEETRSSLENFKKTYKKIKEDSEGKEVDVPLLSEKEVEELYYTLKWAKQILSEMSHKDIEFFKENLPASVTQAKKYVSAKILPEKMISRAINPQNISDQITWICIGTANSCEEIILTLYKIGKWVLQSPYHIYLVFSGQGEYPNWKNV